MYKWKITNFLTNWTEMNLRDEFDKLKITRTFVDFYFQYGELWVEMIF